MKTHAALEGEHFDRFAADYDAELNKGLAISGETKEYFAQKRVEWLAYCLRERAITPATVVDFGCGTGTGVQFLREALPQSHVIGVDTSARSLDIARARYADNHAEFILYDDWPSTTLADVVFCNGVFHHIAPSERAPTLAYLRARLRPGGVLALWENNPWSPAARYVMSRIPFDADASMVTAGKIRQTLQSGGFAVLRTDYLFLFPSALRWLRGLESPLRGLPLGAQYQVLGQNLPG